MSAPPALSMASPQPQVPAYYERPAASVSSYSVAGPGVFAPPRPLEETEREQILSALQQFQGNRVRTARRAYT